MRNFSEQIERLNYAVEQTAAPETIDKLRALYEQRSKYNADFDRKYEALTKTIYEIDPSDRDTSAEALSARDELKALFASYVPRLEPIASQIEQLLSECNNAYIESVRGDKDRVLQDAAATMEADKGNFIDLRSFESTIANTCMAYLHPEARRSYKVEDPTRPGEYIETPSEYITAANRKYDQEHDLYSLLNGLAIFFVIFDLEGWNKAELERLAWENLPYLVTESGEIEPNVFTKEWQAKKNMPLAELVKEMERNSAAAGMPGEPTDSETAAKELLNKISEIERTALNIPLEGYYRFSNNTLGRIPKPAAGTLGEYQNITLEGWEDEEATEEVNSSIAPYFRILTAYKGYKDTTAAVAALTLTGLEPISRYENFLASVAPALEAFASLTFTVRPNVDSKKGKTTITPGARGTTKITYEDEQLRIERTVKEPGKKNGVLTLKLLLVISSLFLETKKRDIVFDYAEFEQLCYGNNAENKNTRKSRHSDFSKAIDALKECNIKLIGNSVPLKSYMQYIGDHTILPNGEVHIDIGANYAKHLLTKRLYTYYPKELLRIDNNDPNSYLLGEYLNKNYYRYDRQQKGIHNRLTVASILDEGIFTSIKTLEEKGAARDWERRIKEPFEKALEYLTFKYEILSKNQQWHYLIKGDNGEYIPLPDGTEITNYRTFSALAIFFEMEHPHDISKGVSKYAARIADKAEKTAPKAKKKASPKRAKSAKG